jgi:Na+-translocating ferredoxin:NAD+ oxidoreductase subunit B
MCGFGGCMPYAQALASGSTTANRCAPGGLEVMTQLNALSGQSNLLLEKECLPAPSGAVAVIDEQWCIGCTKCIAVCPVDAIIGASKKMHTVIQVLCTGCDLCQPVCPVDCISMQTRPAVLNPLVSRQRAELKRERFSQGLPEQAAPPIFDTAAILAAALARAIKQ